MKTAFFFVIGYLLASLLATSFLLALQPPHAHFPTLIALAFFPLYPVRWVGTAFLGTIAPLEVMALAVFVLLMGTSVYLAFKARQKAAR
ncbi:hypothetical protein [Polaromonas sp.]|uniref:hypothetical protein n=1 Tax=Polaromonas sp. TaxID=1869339 RepID=UPI00326753C2